MIELVQSILVTQGLEAIAHKEYAHGEMDLYCNGIYYEFKANDKLRLKQKAYDQLTRAIKFQQCNYGYLVTPSGVYDILGGQ